MQVLPSTISPVAVASLIASLLVLAVSSYNLYLSHFKTGRSEVSLLRQEGEVAALRGGSATRWNNNAELKLVNTGDKGGLIASTDDKLLGLRKDGDVVEDDTVTLEINRNAGVRAGTQIEPHSTHRYRPRITIETTEDAAQLMQYDTAVVRYRMVIEDNKGSYEIEEIVEHEMTGPRPAQRSVKDTDPES